MLLLPGLLKYPLPTETQQHADSVFSEVYQNAPYGKGVSSQEALLKVQGDSGWLRKGCITHPLLITTSTAAHPSGRMETCSSSFPHPPEGCAGSPSYPTRAQSQPTALVLLQCEWRLLHALHPPLLTLPPPTQALISHLDTHFPTRWAI